MEERFFSKMNLDALGIGASLVCAVHCALLPMALAIMPLLGISITDHAGVEYGLLSFSFLIGCVALGRGYYRYHRRRLPLLLFATGFILLLVGHFRSMELLWEYTLICVGAAAIVAAHLMNHRKCRDCRIHKH
ncbi:MAG TPA: MerC domain-containing protein [Chitinophaga sp.]|uniref:MerC domain-containing protein n=1 Tax=Chitinophaga sp. TaxID=1869181 RepID=UPI002BACB2E3|nr:MerC domain-containing protein [Chitinophaga sp.]HVI48906.1 MerC domain-containing protein [Chitinophaga sp.]